MAFYTQMDILMQDPPEDDEVCASMQASFTPCRDFSLFDDVLPLATIDFPDTNFMHGAFQSTAEEARRVLQLPPRGRSRPIPSALWERHKPMIEELYIRQDLKLEEVILRMKEEYSFNATDKMYKKRLRDWNLRKNYTQEQKKEAIQILSREQTDHHLTSLLDSSGRPIHVHRLLRPVQRKGNRIELLDRRNCKHLHRRSVLPCHTTTISRLVLQQSTESQNVESLLRCAQVYFSWYAAQETVKNKYYMTKRLVDFSDGLYMGAIFLSTNPDRAFTLLNKSCSDFLVLLKEQPFRLTSKLVGHLTDLDQVWGSRHPIRRSLMEFLASSAEAILGATHPIANFVSLLRAAKSEQFEFLSSRQATLLENVATAITDSEISHTVQLSAVDLLKMTGQFEAAWVLCRRLWDSVQPLDSSSPVSSSLKKWTLESMVELSRLREDYGPAEELNKQRISRVIEATGKSNGNHEGYMACWDLALCYGDMGRNLESKKYFRLALDGALQCEDGDREGALRILDDFEWFVKEHGSEEELAQLQDEYGYLWAGLDEWALRPSPLGTDDG